MSSLWKGPDHLVYVRGSGFLLPYTEEYKRYRFRDIQVFSVAKRSRIGMAMVYSLGVFLFAIPVVLVLALTEAEDFGTGSAVFVSLCALGLLASVSLIARHLILGPTCTCDIQTSLSRDRLRPLNRYWKTLEIVEAVEAEIRGSQEALGGEGTRETGILPAGSKRSAAIAVPGPVFPTFFATLAFGLGCLAALHLESLVLTGALLVLLIVVSFLLTFSLVASMRRATPELVRALLWCVLGGLFVFLGGAVVYLFLSAARDPAYTVGVTGPLEAFSGIAAEGGFGFYLFFAVLSLGMFVVGVSGLVISSRWRGKLAKSVAPAPVEKVGVPAAEEAGVPAAEDGPSTGEESDG